MTDEHVHDFGDPAAVPPRTARICRVDDCGAWGVAWRKRWREPTPTELVSITARMMEDVAIAQAMQIIHGREGGMRRARQVLGYGEGVT